MASKPTKDTDFLYASARIRARESQLIGQDKWDRMIEAGSLSEVDALLAEAGVLPSADAGIGSGKRELYLETVLHDTFDLLLDMTPSEDVIHVFQYPYDCNNLKAALKCHIRQVSCEDLLFAYGSVPTDRIGEMAASRQFDAMPPHMAEAALTACEAYERTLDPQQIDTILDRACYEDMLAAAQACGDAFLLRLVQTRLDLTNITMSLRVIRMGSRLGEARLTASLLTGGLLPPSFFPPLVAKGEDTLLEALRATVYTKLADRLAGAPSLGVTECICDNYYMETLREARYVPFGAAVLCAYLTAVEYMIKNIRIIVAGKEAGLSSDTIRERVRDSYV